MVAYVTRAVIASKHQEHGMYCLPSLVKSYTNLRPACNLVGAPRILDSGEVTNNLCPTDHDRLLSGYSRDERWNFTLLGNDLAPHNAHGSLYFVELRT